MTWLGARKHIAWIGIGLLAVLLVSGWGIRSCQERETTKARLARNQVQAGQNSAKDAIDTVGAANGRETGIQDTTRANDAQIRAADGASDAVKPAVRDAGLQSLCRRASYKETPRCASYR